MLLTIVRRETLDHLMSLRFGLALAITTCLMVVNGIVFCGPDYEARLAAYNERVAASQERLEGRAGSLAKLAVEGPGALNKRPSPLGFCAAGGEAFLPASIDASSWGTYGGGWGFMIRMPWHVHFSGAAPQAPPSAGTVPEFVDVDWVFIVGFCMSLLALVLTYDSVCGERQAGTLRLMLSGVTPRYVILLGKFLAAWGVLLAVLSVGILVNLLIIRLIGPVEFTTQVWIRLAAMVAACMLYLAFFVALGLLVSTLSERAVGSLVCLLLVWVVLVILLPNTTAGIISSLDPDEADWDAYHERQQELFEEHRIWSQESPVADGERFPYDYVEVFSDFLRVRLRLDQGFQEEALRRQLAPVKLGRALSRLSPHGVLQYAMESLADTGLPRHLRFLEAAKQYAQTFRRFVDEQDQGDPDSYHLFGVSEGLSQRAVTMEAIPRFVEPTSARLSIADAGSDLAVLALLAVVAFMAANAAFLRGDVV